MKWLTQEETSLKRYLSRRLPMPDYRIKALLERGLVRVDGTPAKKDAPLDPDQEVEVRLPRSFLPKIPILFSSEEFLVVEKPRGIETCDSETQALTLADTLHLTGYEDALPCHRLDVHTGGVMLFARGQAAEMAARELFVHRDLTKRYRCVCVGTPRSPQGDLRAFLLRRDGKSYVQDTPAPATLEIHTGYRVLALQSGLCLAEVDLFTGRTHQIRAHMAYLGAPIVGDDLYGRREANRAWGVRYPCLWATELSFPELSGELSSLSQRRFTSEPQFPEKVTSLFI